MSNLRLILISKVRVFVQFQVVMTVSVPSWRNKNRGRRLTKKAIFTAVLTLSRAQCGGCSFGVRVVRMG